MNLTPLSAKGIGGSLIGFLISIEESSRFKTFISWFTLVIGIVVWTGVQTTFVAIPLWTRSLLPEAKDTLTYVLKTQEMEECFFRDCPALEDLRKQVGASKDPELSRQRVLMSSRCCSTTYHPLFSVILLGIKGFLGLDLLTVYKVVWTLGPLFFGVAFAYLLTSLWGRAAAGFALILLAFKVFPDTGLQYVVPSNIAMGLASLLWARIVSRKGDAPWCLVMGSLALITMHPIGRLYSVMAICVALLTSGLKLRPRNLFPIFLTLCFVGLSFVSFPFYKGSGFVTLSFFPADESWFLKILQNAGESFLTVVIEIVRLRGGLFGSMPVFCGAVILGFCTLRPAGRVIALRITRMYFWFLFALLFWVSSHPGDVQLRMWIPFVAILFGAVGQGFSYAFQGTSSFLIARLRNREMRTKIRLRDMWTLVTLGILLGYSFQMITLGAEQIMATAEYMQNREPLALEPSQPELLLSKAKPGDSVLYTSMTIMPYYFIQGAMRLGAVYYHPTMQHDPSEIAWLTKSNLKFAVSYNPAVYHPSFEGIDEIKWWITSPNFHYSPLNRPRIHGPIMQEGVLRASDLQWIDVQPKAGPVPEKLKMLVTNPGGATQIGLVSLDRREASLSACEMTTHIPAAWSGWLEFDIAACTQDAGFRITFSHTNNRLAVKGIVFDDDRLHWPWLQKALMSFMSKDPYTGSVARSYDPATLLPNPLNKMNVTVLDDGGSSVLLEIHP